MRHSLCVRSRCAADAGSLRADFAGHASDHQHGTHSAPLRKRGRPGQGTQPAQVVYQIDGALASSLTARQARIDQHSCFILATNELDPTQLPPHEVLAGYQGQVHAERGFRFLKDPQFFASSFYLKKPERIMALLMVMTVCLLVYAALAYRIRKALKDHDATFPDQKGKPVRTNSAMGLPLFCRDSSAQRIRAVATGVKSD